MSERELIRLDGVPVYQNKMYDDEESARDCPRGDVVIAQQTRSGLVRNIAFDPSSIEYDGSYQNEQGHSATFRSHIDQVLERIARHFSGKRILEIGCGKGTFVEAMRDAGLEASGMDPAYEGTSPHVQRRAFTTGADVHTDAIVMRHVLEHVPSPYEFLCHIRDANRRSGWIYVEVPCFDWIVEQRAWFDVFYEHVNYFRVDDFRRLFGTVADAGHLFGGQYIYVVADLESLRDPAASVEEPRRAHLPPAFFGAIDACAQRMRESRSAAIWGAAAKGVMFAHHLAARGVAPALAIDINPAKQGRFLAGSGLPVLPPGEAMAKLGPAPDIFVMNSNYLPEIRSMGGPGPTYIAVDQT